MRGRTRFIQTIDMAMMRFICEIGDDEHLVDADTFEAAAEAAVRAHAESRGETAGRYTVKVSEANEADFPLVSGEDYTVTLPV
ncbi:hypothetical protein SSPSH_002710 [Salinisphaera shabanensis E1L3A]|jgi:DNA-binding SARP family transcriptional activator|uniref:Uncharacterized protein n=2 Tax=Salinisphaera shabanensis TaxID=180542 RepID=F7Q8H3_9GAMM|nr:hypothetical protein SSPSH_002710 [Salinisphaera shabanensis E1L3A]